MNSFFKILIVLAVCTFTVCEARAKDESLPCPLYQAQYKPHPNYHSEKGKLDFVMMVRAPEPGEGGGAIRSTFFNIDAFDNETGQKVSTLRMGDVCSNGVVVCSVNGEMGQFNSMDELIEFNSSINFFIYALNKDFSEVRYSGPVAPYVYIFPHTMNAITSEKRRNSAYINEYVHYYTKEEIFPDFSGYDVWILSSCSSTNK